jgi:hypothetical protein
MSYAFLLSRKLRRNSLVEFMMDLEHSLQKEHATVKTFNN